MSIPIFLHFYSNGHIYFSNEALFTPGVANTGSSGKFKAEAGTLLGTIRVNSDGAAQQLTTLSGTVGTNLAMTGATGKFGTEVT